MSRLAVHDLSNEEHAGSPVCGVGTSSGGPPKAATSWGNDSAGLRAFDAADIGLGHRGCRQAALERHSECLQGLRNPGRAHHVDPNTPGGLERGRSGKALQPGIHEANRAAAARWLLSQNATRNGDRAAVGDSAESVPDQVDLAHEFVVEAETEISIRELVEGLEAGLTGSADHRADLADFRVQASDGCRVGYVDV